MVQRCYLLTLSSCLALTRGGAAEDIWTARGEAAPEGVVHLAGGNLRLTVINNRQLNGHQAGYNGLALLEHCAQPGNLFVPSYAGLNYEHLFDAERCDFAPRQGPMTVHRLSENSVGLYQAAEDSPWGMESFTTFTLQPPQAIDFTFECRPHRESFAGGYFGAFWASYIHQPAVRSLYFLGHRRGESGPARWITAFSPRHGVQSAHFWDQDRVTVPLPDQATLVRPSDYEFTEFFYYGRSGSLVWVMMFDPASLGPDESLRFAQSPTGGGDRNPAWDFYYLVRHYRVGETYGFRARAVLKVFVSSEDVIREYESWTGRAVPRPAEPEPVVGEMEGPKGSL